MNEERNERPQRRPQQSRQGGTPARRPASAQQSRQGGAPARRPASAQQSRQGSAPARRPASSQQSRQGGAPARRPASSQQSRQGGTPARRPAAAVQKQPARKVKRNYTRVYMLIGAVAAICLLGVGIYAMKNKNPEKKAPTQAQTNATTTTTTTEPIVTEPPIVQQLTFDTESMYSVVSGAEIAEFNGDRKMKVYAPEGTDTAEITWNLAQMVGTARVADIRAVSMDLTCSSSVPFEQCSSSLRALIPKINAETGVQEGFTPLKISDILLVDHENASKTWHVEIKIPKGMFGDQVNQLSFVRYADDVQADLYLDNIELLDGYGNPIDITYNASDAHTGANTVPPTDTTTAVPDVTTTVLQ